MHHAKKNENTVLKRNTCFFIHAHNEPNRLLHALSKQPHLAAFQKLFQERKEMRLTLYLPLNKCFNSRSILPEDSNSSLACRRLIFSLTYRPSLWSLFTKRDKCLDQLHSLQCTQWDHCYFSASWGLKDFIYRREGRKAGWCRWTEVIKRGRVARPSRRATSFSDSTRYGGWRGGGPLKFFR